MSIRGGQELRPGHERPAARRARVLRVRRQQRDHPDLRDRGDRHVQEGSVGARTQRAPGRAPARSVSQHDGGLVARRSRWRTAARSASRCRRTRSRTRATTRGRWISASSRSRSRSATPIRRRRRSSSPRTSTCAIRGDALGLAHGRLRARADLDRRAVPGQPRAARAAGRRSTQFYADGAVVVDAPGLHANEFLTLKDEGGKSALTRWDKTLGKAVPVKKLRDGVWGIKPRNTRAALRARPLARRRRQAGHARRQGRHRQDAARDRRGAAEGHRGAGVLEAARRRGRSSRSAATSATCPATSRRS